MKRLLITLIAACLINLSCENSIAEAYNPNEIIFVVEMDANEGKSIDDIAEFSNFYTEAINKKEPNSLGWGFFDSGEKIILIERYLDENAMMQHAKNISEGGILETHFTKFMQHFTINKIDVYGTTSDQLKEFVKPFGLPFYFHPDFAKFSRN